MYLKSIVFSSLLLLAKARSTPQCYYVVTAYEKMGGNAARWDRNSEFDCCNDLAECISDKDDRQLVTRM